jgi:hypothetical protein
MYNTTPAPDKERRAFYAGRNRERFALRPVYAPYGVEQPEPEDRYHPAPAPNAYTDEVAS